VAFDENEMRIVTVIRLEKKEGVMEKKIQKKFVDQSLGFPVMLLNAPLVKVRGQWALHINYNE